jgi:hypothetical protein
MKNKAFRLTNLPGHLARFLNTKPATEGATDVSAMNNRVHLLDALYSMDGRSEPSHESHGLYTGLTAKYVQR